jgi:hypothetical protein
MAAQLPDTIGINGEKANLYSNPLEEYWIQRSRKRPEFYSVPNCTRGYIANWLIMDKQLFLKGIDGNIRKRSLIFLKKWAPCTLKALFPGYGKGLIKATWFSGRLRIPRGKMTVYEHTGYDSRFEKELIISVDNGDVIKMVTLDNMQKTLVVSEAK